MATILKTLKKAKRSKKYGHRLARALYDDGHSAEKVVSAITSWT